MCGEARCEDIACSCANMVQYGSSWCWTDFSIVRLNFQQTSVLAVSAHDSWGADESSYDINAGSDLYLWNGIMGRRTCAPWANVSVTMAFCVCGTWADRWFLLWPCVLLPSVPMIHRWYVILTRASRFCGACAPLFGELVARIFVACKIRVYTRIYKD